MAFFRYNWFQNINAHVACESIDACDVTIGMQRERHLPSPIPAKGRHVGAR